MIVLMHGLLRARFRRPGPALLLLLFLLVPGCRRGENGSSPESGIVNGVRHLYYSGEPAEGTICLEVRELLRIDPVGMDSENPPLFNLAVKDAWGNLYLADGRAVRIFKFNPRGEKVWELKRKGEGPGEFNGLSDLQSAGENLWMIGAWPLKVARFSLDGRYAEQWSFATFQNFYLRTRVIGDGRFLTVCYRDKPGGGRIRVSAVMNPNEELTDCYYEDESAGILRIRPERWEGPALVSTNPLAAADIHHAYDADSGVVYVCNNREYSVVSKNLDGTARFVIHNTHPRIELDTGRKDDLLHRIAPRLNEERRRLAKEQLPGSLNALAGIVVFPRGHLAVFRFKDLETVEIDVFDGDGRFVVTIPPSPGLPDLRRLLIFENTIGFIDESGAAPQFVEYRVTNLKSIFD